MSADLPERHDPRTCGLCRKLRHPSQVHTRRALAAGLPRQKDVTA